MAMASTPALALHGPPALGWQLSTARTAATLTGSALRRAVRVVRGKRKLATAATPQRRHPPLQQLLLPHRARPRAGTCRPGWALSFWPTPSPTRAPPTSRAPTSPRRCCGACSTSSPWPPAPCCACWTPVLLSLAPDLKLEVARELMLLAILAAVGLRLSWRRRCCRLRWRTCTTRRARGCSACKPTRRCKPPPLQWPPPSLYLEAALRVGSYPTPLHRVQQPLRPRCRYCSLPRRASSMGSPRLQLTLEGELQPLPSKLPRGHTPGLGREPLHCHCQQEPLMQQSRCLA